MRIILNSLCGNVNEDIESNISAWFKTFFDNPKEPPITKEIS